jgi:hypothetical protein
MNRRGTISKPFKQLEFRSIQMRKNSKKQAVFVAVLAVGGVAGMSHAATFTPFTFTSNTSTDVPNTALGGDVLLNSVTTDGITIPDSQLQTVSGTTILVDNGVDAVNGGHNLTSGRGVGSTDDSLAPEGPATVTPTSADLQSSQANFNLTSITVTRENVGTATTEYNFANPTNTFFYWERGIDSDATIEALDASQDVVATFKILRQNETPTGIFISTENGAFNITNQQLGSIGLQVDQPVSELIVSSTQLIAGGGPIANGDDGPDYKILATAGPIAAVPEPASAGALVVVGALTLLRRRRGIA